MYQCTYRNLLCLTEYYSPFAHALCRGGSSYGEFHWHLNAILILSSLLCLVHLLVGLTQYLFAGNAACFASDSN